MASTLRPFRDYDEKDVINLYAVSGTSDLNRGHLMKIQGDGWVTTNELEMLGSVGKAYGNTVSERYGVQAKVTKAGAGDVPIGMTLMDVKEEDENGEKLKFNPRKAAEMGVVLSGQAVPIVSKGVFLYSGTTLASEAPTAGQKLYCGANGLITTGVASNAQVGVALGVKDSDGCVLIRLECGAH